MALQRITSGQLADVRPLGERLGSSTTAAILKAGQLEVIRIVLPAGKGLPEHAAPGEITVQCIEGCVDFSTHSATHRMRAGDLIHLTAGQPHALSAIESASLLLTICLVAP
jgi:quercetin dioxygenase-like cupin family protein